MLPKWSAAEKCTVLLLFSLKIEKSPWPSRIAKKFSIEKLKWIARKLKEYAFLKDLKVFISEPYHSYVWPRRHAGISHKRMFCFHLYVTWLSALWVSPTTQHNDNNLFSIIYIQMSPNTTLNILRSGELTFFLFLSYSNSCLCLNSLCSVPQLQRFGPFTP